MGEAASHRVIVQAQSGVALLVDLPESRVWHPEHLQAGGNKVRKEERSHARGM